MPPRLVPLARCLGLGVLLLGVSLGCGGDNVTPQPPAPKPMPDAARSTVVVDRSADVLADGQAVVGITVTVMQKDGTPMTGRTVHVEVSGEGNTVTQPGAKTDAQGVTHASVVSTRAGVKTVTASVDAEGGAVVLGAHPTVTFVAPRAVSLAFTASALSATAGGLMSGLEVAVRDAQGRTVVGATDAVTLSLSAGPGGAALEGTLSAHAVDGVARFSEVLLKKAGTGYVLKAEATGLTAATSPSFEVAPGAAAKLVVTDVPAVVTAGAAQSARVTLRDAYDNVATNYVGTVGVSSSDAGASLPAAHVFTATDAGQFTFTGIVLKRAGEQNLAFRDAALSALVSVQDVRVSSGPAAQLAFAHVASQVSVHAALGLVEVVLQDAYGNRAAASTPAVTLALAQAGGSLGGVVTVAPVDGVASFTTLSIPDEGRFQLRATAPGLQAATSAEVVVVDDVPPSRPVLALAGSTTTSVTVTWTAVGDDADQGRATSQELRYSTAPIDSAAAFNAATPVAVGAPAAAGSAESAVISGLTAGQNYHVALRVTDNQGLSARSASLAVSTQDPQVSQIAFVTQPVDGTSGTALADVRVALQDSSGATVTKATSAVTLSLTGQSSFPAVTQTAVNGVATFSGLRVDTAGSYTFTATSGSLPAVTSQSFTVRAGAAVSLSLVGLVAPVIAGASQSVEVTVKDAAGNVATGYTGTVHFTSTDAQAVLPANFTFSSADAGHKVFSGVTLKTAGSQTVTATDTVNAALTASLTVEVSSSGGQSVTLEGLPSTVVAGSARSLTVTVRDSYGNISSDYAGTVHFTSTDAQAVLPADAAFMPGDAGRKVFPGVVLKTAGSRAVTVTDVANAALSGSASTVVEPGPAASLTLAVANASPVSGAPVSATVTARDAHGNVATGYVGRVAFTSTDAQAQLPGDYLFVASDAGAHVFSVTFLTAAPGSLTVTDTAQSTLTANVAVTPVAGPAATFSVQAEAGPYVAGAPVSFDLTVRDAHGNVSTGYVGTVHVSASDAQAVLPADQTFSAADSGRHTFSVAFHTAGSQTVTFTDTADASLSASHTDDVGPAAATVLVFTSAPTTGQVRQPLADADVVLRDAYGNRAQANGPQVTVSLVGAALLGGTTTRTPSSGQVTFSGLTVDGEGTYQLRATANGLSDATSGNLVISDTTAPGVASDLAASTLSATSIKVSWTATGDDGSQGTAQSYDLRYATSPISEANFASATPASSLPAPQAPGAAESVSVSGLVADTLYYFALRVTDNAGNGSALAFASATTGNPCTNFTCTPPSPACGADGVSRVTYASACEVQGNQPVCVNTPTSNVCPGAGGVCYAGACGTASSAAAGELVISEVMHSPSAGTTEYVELTNVSTKLLDAAGLTLSYDNGAGSVVSYTLDAGPGAAVPVGASHTLVVAQDKSLGTNGGVSADLAYGSALTLGSTGRLTVKKGATVVDDLTYTNSYPQTVGRAMTLASSLVGTPASARPWYWCDAVQDIIAGGDRGTPNRVNDTCGLNVTPPVDWCAIQYPKTFPVAGDANYPATILTTDSKTITSRFYDMDVTTRNLAGNDFYPRIEAELGYGTDVAHPEAWTWTSAAFNPSYAGASPNDDEMQATLHIPTTGTYLYGFRYRFQEPGQPWTYCDQTGIAVPPSGTYGSVVVASPVQGPAVSSAAPGVIARGARLIVTGVRFTGTTSVTVGGVAQTFTVDSDTQLTLASLADATPIAAQPIVVTSPNGSSAPQNVTVIDLLISELDADQVGTDTKEFVELSTGVPGVNLSGYVLVFYNGANNQSYLAVDLNTTTDAGGRVVVGNTGAMTPAPLLTFANGLLQNGEDGVAVYQNTAASFPNNTAVTATRLIDALVYNNAATPLATGLLNALLWPVGDARRVQANENATSSKDTVSIQRCGAGRRDGRVFSVAVPTPGAANTCP
ncbi:Ig-like domain-containing protein [Myxococcaceae bacterium JPH2]|nr:Ig-like domain-containing protein [Myxococcaceae bacterium JPH2]